MNPHVSMKEAKKIIRELLKHAPIPHCFDMHHGKKDRHGWHDPCPVVERAMKIRHQAEAFILANNEPKPHICELNKTMDGKCLICQKEKEAK